MGAERDRVAGFGRLEDGLLQPGTEWYWWGEDGLAGFSDIEQRRCLSLVLWNGRRGVTRPETARWPSLTPPARAAQCASRPGRRAG